MPRTPTCRRSGRSSSDEPAAELRELTGIYVRRGLEPALAHQVAEQLTAHDALGAHARDELGISETLRARPIQAALASAASFAVGALLPLAVAAVAPRTSLMFWISRPVARLPRRCSARVAARAGGASMSTGAGRVTFWGALAMAITAGIGALFGATL